MPEIALNHLSTTPDHTYVRRRGRGCDGVIGRLSRVVERVCVASINVNSIFLCLYLPKPPLHCFVQTKHDATQR